MQAGLLSSLPNIQKIERELAGSGTSTDDNSK